MGDNHYCYVCGRSASVFGVREMKKVNACKSHESELLKRKFAIYNIEGFRFVSSAGDFSEFDNRRGKKEVALVKLKLLQKYCDEGRNRAAEETSMAQRVNGVNRKLGQRHHEITVYLQTLRRNLNNWVGVRTAQLSPVEQCLISDLRLDENKAMREMTRLMTSVAPQLKKQLKKAIVLCSTMSSVRVQLSTANLENSLTSLQLIGPQCDESEVQRAIAHHIERAHQQFDSHQIENCVHDWQSALSLLTPRFPHSKVTANAHFELGLLYLWYLALYREAEAAFQNSLDIEKSISPHSGDSCKVLSYLGFAKYRLGKDREAEENLTCSLADAKNSETTAMALCFLGKLYRGIGRSDESETTLMRAYAVSVDIPKAHALVARYLGDLWRKKKPREAEEKYLEALSFFRTQPDIQLANCLFNCGKLQSANKLSEAELSHREAIQIYRSFSRTKAVANCVYSLAKVLQGANKLIEAEQGYREAMELYRSLSKSIEMANCLFHLGTLQQGRNKLSEAEEGYRKALEIYRSFSKSTQIANCLVNLGSLLQGANKLSEAEQLYREAICMYRFSRKSIQMANCLHHFGSLLEDMNKFSEVEQGYKEAIKIYRFFPRSIDMANCLYLLGAFLKSENRLCEAELSLIEAMKIYRPPSRKSGVAHCLAIFREIYDASEKP